jgi:hypothetical protein
MANPRIRVGQVAVRDAGSFGPCGTEARCHPRRGGHQWSTSEPVLDRDEVTWTRSCPRCHWSQFVVPEIAGPHRLVREFEGFGMRFGKCNCGEPWDLAGGRCFSVGRT